ncbi:MAG: phosphoenolpyruvate--protein phosphotransferase, partial [Myxococcales bacterium]
RFDRAVSHSRAEIEAAKQELTEQHGQAYASILDVYLLMHGDALLIDAIRDAIAEEHINAEWALTRVAERLKAPLLRDSSSYFRERARDVDHVKEHLLRHLYGEDRAEPVGDEPVVLLAHDLTPADAVRMLGSPTVGLVTELGASSGHTAILSRALGVPAVMGVGPLPLEIEDDSEVVVDGFSGKVVIGPSRDERESARARRARFLAFLSSERATSAVTKDGTSITVAANMELPSELDAALESGAHGVGLYRTEFLCLDRGEPPSEQEQLEIYQRVAATMTPHRVVFRTFDWRGDKRPAAFELSDPQGTWLRAQVRAILRAGRQGSVALMFPMVSTVQELLDAKDVVERCRTELCAQIGPCAPIPVGMMVEVPSAALLADRFARHADFFAVGTNDLSHYTLAVDRNDAAVSIDTNSLEPAVLELLARTIRAATDAGIPCSMCGDMAANPVALSLALGMGYRQLSVPVRMLPLVRSVVRDVDLELMTLLAHEALDCDSGDEVRRLLQERMEGFDPLWVERTAL